MSDCSQHKKDLFGQTDMKVVAEAIGDLRYETLAQLILELSGKFLKDSGTDWINGRVLLAAQLASAHNCLHQCYFNIYQAYEISKPFMEQKNNNQ